MEALVREVTETLKKAISFLEKVKVDKKLKAEKDSVVNDLKQSLKRCSDNVKLEDEETYNDVAIDGSGDIYNDVSGENYNDVSLTTGDGKSTPEQDNVYNDTGGDTYDDVSVSEEKGKKIQPIECEKLTNPVISDYIDLKKSKSLLKSPWQKRWCVLHSGILYIYEGSKDKQQKDAFDLKGYKFQFRDDITKEAKRKDRCFELKNDDLKKSYEFCATDKENLSKWQAALQMRPGARHAPPASCFTEETYDDVVSGNDASLGDSSKPKKKGLNLPLFGKKKAKSISSLVAEEENTYNDTEQDSADTYQDTANETYNDTAAQGGGDTYMEYDDTGTELSPPPEDANDTYEDYDDNAKAQRPLPPRMLNPSSIGKQRRSSARDELPPVPGLNSMPRNVAERGSARSNSNFTGGLPPPLPSREETGSGSGTLNRIRPPMQVPGDAGGHRALPPPPPNVMEERGMLHLPTPPLLATQSGSENELTSDHEADSDGEKWNGDYENLFQGMWDCEPDEDNELRFKRGEVVHILSREYDSYGWWTAESRDDEVGLVPVSYLTEAYEI